MRLEERDTSQNALVYISKGKRKHAQTPAVDSKEQQCPNDERAPDGVYAS